MKKNLLLLLCYLFTMTCFGQDVWLQNHFSPNSGNNLSSSETVTVLINNNSAVTMTANTITVKYSINNGPAVAQLLSSNLLAGASWNFSFSVKANLSSCGTYEIKAWVERAGDNNSLNNTLIWTVQNSCPLPVTFGRLLLSKNEKGIHLDWNTISETNNKAFFVYRSNDDANYTEVHSQNSKGTGANSYTFLDNNAITGINYYRLSQQDLDGKITTLADDVINFSFDNTKVKAWPNPVRSLLNVSFKAGKYQTLELKDINGKKLHEKPLNTTQSETKLDLSKYSKGIYLIKLSGKFGSETVKVLK